MMDRPFKSRAGLRRGLVLTLALAAMISAVEAKIVQQPPTNDPPATQSEVEPQFNYYIFGAVPGWWSQNPAMYRWSNPAVWTLSFTDRLLHDAVALRLARDVERRAIRFNSPNSWIFKGLRGVVTPLRTFRSHSGLMCRDFEHKITFVGKGSETTLAGTACRQLDGAWTLLADGNVDNSVNQPTAN